MDCKDEVVDMRKRNPSQTSTTDSTSSKRNRYSRDNSPVKLESEPQANVPSGSSKPASIMDETAASDEVDLSEAEDQGFTACEDEAVELDASVPVPSPMDPALRELIQKYVRADYVIHCLELAGFDSAVVFSCLNCDSNIRQLENFVGNTCALMRSPKARQYFLGPLYANHPANFKLPAGVVCGIRLAVEEVKRSNPFVAPPSPSMGFHALADATTQTDNSHFGLSSRASSSEGSPPDPAFANPAESSLIGGPPPAHISSSSGDGASAFHHHHHNQAAAHNLSSSIDSDCKRLLDCIGGRFSGMASQPALQAHSPQPRTPNTDNIDVERLIHHSSASACRLAARQFVNANLVRGQHFDMEMEVSGGENGQKRVTGIFYCHLCREKRERTCAVRFSVARNRYPVMSNVLSHLKTHFQYQSSIAASSAGGSNAVKKLAPPLTPSQTVPPPQGLPSLPTTPAVSSGALIDPSGAVIPPPYLSPNSICNFVSRVVQMATSANSLNPADMSVQSQVPLGQPLSLPSKLSPVN